MKRIVAKISIILACILDLVIGYVEYHRFRMTYGQEEFAQGWIGIVLCLGPYIAVFIGGVVSYFLLERES